MHPLTGRPYPVDDTVVCSVVIPDQLSNEPLLGKKSGGDDAPEAAHAVNRERVQRVVNAEGDEKVR